MESRVRIEILNSQEYSLNLLYKHSVKVYNPYLSAENLYVTIRTVDQLKVEKLLRDYGKEYKIVNKEDKLFALKKLLKRNFYFVGVMIGVFLIMAYSTLITTVKINGTKKVDDEVIKGIVIDELKLPATFKNIDLNALENRLLRIDGIGNVSVTRKGKTIVVDVVEELQNIDIWDTKNFNIVTAKESGKILKMVVYGGTPVVEIGNEVQEGDPLIMPFVGDGEVKNPTVAFGEITAIVVREINLKYSSEEEFNAKSGSEIIDSIERIKSNLNNEEHFLTFQTTKKIVDKTIVCSIYYELVARIA